MRISLDYYSSIYTPATARMQVYFIDNDDYFQRKSVLTDKATSKYFDDNDRQYCILTVELSKL